MLLFPLERFKDEFSASIFVGKIGMVKNLPGLLVGKDLFSR
jgi:hypothetical protein